MPDQKNTESLPGLISQYRHIIRGYIINHTANLDDADDIYQEVCLTMHQKFSDFTTGTNFKAWAMSICRYTLMSWYQGRKSENKHRLRMDNDISEMLLADPAYSEAGLPFEAELGALENCLESMSEKNREIIRQKYLQNCPAAEIASSLRMNVDSVYVTLTRIREFLEKCIREKLS